METSVDTSMKHGGDIYSFQKETGRVPLDFSENTNPFLLPEGVKQALIRHVDTFSAYPDPHCRELTNAVAQYYELNEEYLLFGNGAADIIFKIAYALQPRKALLLAPTFSEYELSLEKVGTRVHYFELEEREDFRLTDCILEAIVGMEIVYLCNPNNPTGQVCEKECMLRIIEACRRQDTYLVVDECFMDFVEENRRYSVLSEIEHYDKLIVLKAFTKIFAMAGLRLGFCVSSNQVLLGKLYEAGQPWSVSTAAQVAGVACCRESEYVRNSLIEIEQERTYLRNALQKLGIRTYESQANYLLFRCAIDVVEPLKNQGIMIRSCGNYKNLDETYYRIAVKRHAENERLIAALRIVLKV